MAELIINKLGFDGCYDALTALSARLRDMSRFSVESSIDTSKTGEKERQCYEELLKMFNDLAELADETAQNVKLTKARYVLADQEVGELWQQDIIQKNPMSRLSRQLS